MASTIEALRLVFGDKRYLALAAASASALALFFEIVLPVLTIPGNDIAFQLATLSPKGAVLTTAVSAGLGILIAMNVFLLRLKLDARAAGGSGATLGVGAFTGMFASAACPACVGTLFAFLGAPGVLFLVNYRYEIAFLGLAVILTSIWLTARSISGKCEGCLPASSLRKR